MQAHLRYSNLNNQAVNNGAALPKAVGWKRCEIKGGSQEMGVMVS